MLFFLSRTPFIGVFLIHEKSALDKARVHYHHTLEIYHNADDVSYAVVEIIDGYGNIEIMETVDHRVPNEVTEEE